jgi:SAM-dependent methyltransferase
MGIDLWSREDPSGNWIDEIRHQDTRKLDLRACSFDVVLSNLACTTSRLRRDTSGLQEIVRVLKPGGIAVISGYTAISEYKRALTAAGCYVEPEQRIHVLPPLKVLRAHRHSKKPLRRVARTTGVDEAERHGRASA